MLMRNRFKDAFVRCKVYLLDLSHVEVNGEL